MHRIDEENDAVVAHVGQSPNDARARSSCLKTGPIARTGFLIIGLVLVCASPFGSGCGCGGEHPPEVQVATETDGVVTTGVGGSGGDGVDESGAEVPYYCIYNDDNPLGLVGVKHQCGLEYDLEITFTVSPLVGPSFQVPLAVFAVQTVSDESTYEHPFVMACCTDVTTHPQWPWEDSCFYEHHQACVSDFIEHVCGAPGVWLEKSARDHVGQGKEAIEAAAEWFKDHRNDCYDHFWTGPDALHAANYCSDDFVGFFEHTPWEPGLTWSYMDPITHLVLGEVSDVVIAPRSSFNQVTPEVPPSPAESCELPNGNNGEIPPFSLPGSSGTIVSPTAPVPIEVVGPMLRNEPVRGTGELSTSSVLRWHEKSPKGLEIERWTMVEDEPTTVGTSSSRATVDHFKLDLLGSHLAIEAPGGWQLDAEAALFNLIATIDGVGSNVQAINATPVKLYTVDGGVGACPNHVGSCLVSGPFTIGYEDFLGQTWVLDVPSTTWVP